MRLSQVAALVANASDEDRVQFFMHCGLPSVQELHKVHELLANADPKKVALYTKIPQEESLHPQDQAAILFSKYHPEFTWWELEALDEELFKSLSEDKQGNVIEYWGDIDPDDPALIRVIEELGTDKVLVHGEYGIVTVPRGIDLVYTEETYQEDQWEWFKFMTVRSSCEVWSPPL